MSLVSFSAASKGQQESAADFQRIVDGLQAAVLFRPVVVPEVSVRRASGEDEVVVRDVAWFEHAARNVDVPCLGENHLGVLLLGVEHGTDRAAIWAGDIPLLSQPDKEEAGRDGDCDGQPASRTGSRFSRLAAARPANPPPT